MWILFFAFSFLSSSRLLTRTNEIITEHFERQVFFFFLYDLISCTKSNISAEHCNEQQNNKVKESLVVNWIIRYPGGFFLSSICTPVPLYRYRIRPLCESISSIALMMWFIYCFKEFTWIQRSYNVVSLETAALDEFRFRIHPYHQFPKLLFSRIIFCRKICCRM